MKYLHYIVFAALFVIFFLVYQGPLVNVLIYHEQHHLFLYTQDYFQHIVANDGFIGYCTVFLIQFFYYPVLGAILMALLLSLIFLMLHASLVMAIGQSSKTYAAVVPSILLLFYTETTAHDLNLIVISFLCSLGLLILAWLLKIFKVLPLIKHPYLNGGKVKWAFPLAFLFAYAIWGYNGFLKHYNYKEGIMLKVEHFAQNRDWNKVIDYCERYMQTGKNNQFISYFHHLALYHTGQLPARLFDYPQALGVKSIFFPWTSNSRETEYGHYLCEDLGLLNEAQRWEFEAMVVWGETAPHLRNLARYNIANGRPRVAKMYINKLRQSLFYCSQADSLNAILYQPAAVGLRRPFKSVVQTSDKFSNVVNIGQDLEYVLQKDPTNKMAFEYLLSYLLLSNHIVRFAKALPMISRFNYPSMPQAYEEALLIYKMGVGEAEFSKLGFTISPQTEQRFQRYAMLAQRDMATLQREFGHSYWFYLNYISPYGNKVIQDAPGGGVTGVTQL